MPVALFVRRYQEPICRHLLSCAITSLIPVRFFVRVFNVNVKAYSHPSKTKMIKEKLKKSTSWQGVYRIK